MQELTTTQKNAQAYGTTRMGGNNEEDIDDDTMKEGATLEERQRQETINKYLNFNVYQLKDRTMPILKPDVADDPIKHCDSKQPPELSGKT